MLLYPNTRGNVKRNHRDRSARYATHERVLESLFAAYKITHVVEHGMGLSSTKFFHRQPLVHLLSFENNEVWQRCSDCEDPAVKAMHTITVFDKMHGSLISEHVPDPTIALAFIDGPAVERIVALTSCLSRGIEWLIEHDAETFTTKELETRRNLLKTYGYVAKQYIGANPETVFYGKVMPDFTSDPKMYVEF